MADFIRFILPFALAAVAVILFAGLWNMMRGGSANRSQMLMRWRVILQFIAIILMMIMFYFMSK